MSAETSEEPAEAAGKESPDSAKTEDPAPGGGFTTVVSEVIGTTEALVDYLSSRLRLEGHRLESTWWSLLARTAGVLASVALALLGIVLLSLGLADLVSRALGSRAGGLLVLGGGYIVIGAATGYLLTRRRSGKAP